MRIPQSIARSQLPTLVIILLLAMTAQNCRPDMRSIASMDTLTILTRNAPTTYYIGPNEDPRGFEYELASAFAETLGMEPKFVLVNSVSDILSAMAENRGTIAAAGITRTESREERFQFGPAYFDVQQQVIYRRNGPSPDSIPDLIDMDIAVIKQSSYIERLKSLKTRLPELTWKISENLSTEELMQQVAAGSLDATVADANIVAINQRYYPELRVAFPISETQRLAWILNDNVDGLQEALESWLHDYHESGQLAILKQRYYGHTTIFDYVDLRAFHRRIQSRLPRYEDLFHSAARQYQLSWSLLAAQAYQESHWRPDARSPTGVRGMMMLTRITAKSLGVTNRLDPEQSIMGGAEYLHQMISRLPDVIPENEKIRFALAAYNVGMGHLRDARKLAERLRRNPNRWGEMKDVLPLLAHREYYTTLQYGYARGTEPVRYVRRVLNYRDILENEIQSKTAEK